MVLIAVPILIQVYFNSGLTYGLMRLLRVPYPVAAPGALIGASNFFELAVATAIALYGPGSGAALATVVGVLVEVPVMLSVCRFCVATRPWFEASAPAGAGTSSTPRPSIRRAGYEAMNGGHDALAFAHHVPGDSYRVRIARNAWASGTRVIVSFTASPD